MPTLQELILKPNATINILAEITAGIALPGILREPITDETGEAITDEDENPLYVEDVYYIETTQKIYAVRCNPPALRDEEDEEITDETGEAITLEEWLMPVSSLADCIATPYSWYHDGEKLYVHLYPEQSPYGFQNTVQAFARYYFMIGNKGKTFNNIWYDPRLKAAPNISLRIEKNFSGVGQIGGGTLTLINADKFFDTLQDQQWHAGTVTLKVGIDVKPDIEMSYAEYVTVGTWSITDFECGDEFKLKLAERKTQLKKKLPNEFYTVEEYPSIFERDIGKAKQLAYGQIFSARPVLIHQGNKRFKVANHAIKSFDGVRLLEPSSSTWVNSTFATQDLTSGEFTLGGDFDGEQEVAVDFTGKVDAAGVAIANASDIVKDILLQLGETNLNEASFEEAYDRLFKGIDPRGNISHFRSPGLYIDTPREGTQIISEINQLIGSFLYSDSNGQYYYGVFQPMPGEDLDILEDIDVLGYKDNSDTGDIFSKVAVDYQRRYQEDINQHLEGERQATEINNDLKAPKVKTQLLAFYEDNDAQYWLERFLTMNGGAQRLFTCDIPWRGFILQPGQQVLLRYARRQIEEVVEIIEVRIDFAAKKTHLILGNLRGLKDSAGFWVSSGDVLPARFANEAGYGVGALRWNRNWSATIKRWARQNVGYWTDENGFADPLDPASFMGSVWV